MNEELFTKVVAFVFGLVGSWSLLVNPQAKVPGRKLGFFTAVGEVRSLINKVPNQYLRLLLIVLCPVCFYVGLSLFFQARGVYWSWTVTGSVLLVIGWYVYLKIQKRPE